MIDPALFASVSYRSHTAQVGLPRPLGPHCRPDGPGGAAVPLGRPGARLGSKAIQEQITPLTTLGIAGPSDLSSYDFRQPEDHA